MHIAAHLDVDMLALETEDQLSVLVHLTAPAAPASTDARPPSTLQVVLDRSGSMSGDRLDGAKAALINLITRLDGADNFGLVAFDDQTQVVVPAGPLANKDAAKRAIAALDAGGTTDLSGGYLRGLQEAQRVAGPTGATLLLISDGRANAGVTDPDTLAGVAADAHKRNVTTSSLGFGLGYDEKIMSALARGGAGNELFAEEPDTAVTLIAAEVEGLLAQSAQAASLLVRLSPHIRRLQVLNDLPSAATVDGVLIELGAFYAEESRKLLLVFDVPGIPALGLTEVATLVFTYVELPTLKQHTVTVPLHVNVVPGDEAAQRIPDPVVQTERVYQRVQQAKRRASDHLAVGDERAAMSEIRMAQRELAEVLPAAPPELAADLAEEEQSLNYLAIQTQQGEYQRAAKYSSMDASNKGRQRGRPQTGNQSRPPM